MGGRSSLVVRAVAPWSLVYSHGCCLMDDLRAHPNTHERLPIRDRKWSTRPTRIPNQTQRRNVSSTMVPLFQLLRLPLPPHKCVGKRLIIRVLPIRLADSSNVTSGRSDLKLTDVHPEFCALGAGKPVKDKGGGSPQVRVGLVGALRVLAPNRKGYIGGGVADRERKKRDRGENPSRPACNRARR